MEEFFKKIYEYVSTILTGSKKWWVLAGVCASIALYLNFGGSASKTEVPVTKDSTEVKIDTLVKDTLPRLVR